MKDNLTLSNNQGKHTSELTLKQIPANKEALNRRFLVLLFLIASFIGFTIIIQAEWLNKPTLRWQTYQDPTFSYQYEHPLNWETTTTCPENSIIDCRGTTQSSTTIFNKNDGWEDSFLLTRIYPLSECINLNSQIQEFSWDFVEVYSKEYGGQEASILEGFYTSNNQMYYLNHTTIQNDKHCYSFEYQFKPGSKNADTIDLILNHFKLTDNDSK